MTANRNDIARLDLKGPACAAIAMMVTTLGALVGAAQLPLATGTAVVEAMPADGAIGLVRHRSGVIGKVLVLDGQFVAAGDVLATLDAKAIDAEIANLKAQAEAAQRQLDALRLQVEAYNGMLEQRVVSREKVAELEQHVAELERNGAAVIAQITEADRQLAELEIRAPNDGIVRGMHGLAPGRIIAAGETVAEIVPRADRLVLEAQIPAALARSLVVGAEVGVHLDWWSRPEQAPLAARVSWRSPEVAPSDNGRGGQHAIRFELEAPPVWSRPAQHNAMTKPAKVVLRLRDLSLLEQFLQPIRRYSGRSTPA